MTDTVIILLLLANLVLTILNRWDFKFKLPSKNGAEVERAVREAYLQCGLPKDQFSENFNLVRAGKLSDVLVRSARTLDSDQQFETVGDVMDALS